MLPMLMCHRSPRSMVRVFGIHNLCVANWFTPCQAGLRFEPPMPSAIFLGYVFQDGGKWSREC